MTTVSDHTDGKKLFRSGAELLTQTKFRHQEELQPRLLELGDRKFYVTM